MAHETARPISAPTISATDVSGLLARGSSPQRHNAVQVGKCPPPRTRRPRTPIALTEEDMRTLSADEIRKKKNRVSAQRDRDRKKQHVQDLEDMVCELWKRVQYLEGVIASMHPNQDLSGLYHAYEPYAVSRTLQPLMGPPTGGLNEVDMTELAWLLDSIPMDPSNEDEPM
ncbi:Peptide-N(4)-(N-acetyl-beta-glucosaminyl)asparagine amidase [Phytophthora cinnamomi]|uniref:Peptide-N(4)-(N-acetyl-beta- glucosaminyl)asparagine amidase n=1 Tax=Phytophthora cinnamomi TaxID=4785 RepID=UPI00355A2EB8|nr:Peptide-N(4)-(N-acetyl-beta-glucosaminyl)asparagine amidase [Phytophthora cinnamomi]